MDDWRVARSTAMVRSALSLRVVPGGATRPPVSAPIPMATMTRSAGRFSVTVSSYFGLNLWSSSKTEVHLLS